MQVVAQFSDWIKRHYSSRVLWSLMVVSVVFLWAFNVSTLPLSGPTLAKITGSVGLLDALPYYSPQQAIAAMALYGDEGRAVYMNFLRADFVFIPLYCWTLALLITAAFANIEPSSAWSRLNVLPVVVALLDMTENLATIVLLTSYAQPSVSVATIVSVATTAKYSGIALCLGIALLVFLVGLVKRR
ncbi:MAG: hypothetical protein OEW58_07370 [Gammaproteobacteria bacterium]|nr:hypothetical protein [Gammaproteobacteria bacterium]